MLFLNVALSLGWAAVTGSLTLGNLIIGYIIGYGALWVTRFLYGETDYFERVFKILGLVGFFLYDLLMSSLRVLWDVLTPELKTQPGIIAVPLDAETDTEILLVANLITLTPGTLSLDVSPDRRTLYVHAMFIDDAEELKADLKAGMELKVLEAVR